MNPEGKSVFRSSCVKIYLCSNPEGRQELFYLLYLRFVLLTQLFVLIFEDSVMERRGLRERVFPELREYCRHTQGLDVRVSTC